ncbi:MAG: hypothetical protein LQ340_006818 [Diploschistes diacapsis]|nr:MAG: hypothetical protein LQ340_006818 [Diploschistes diacapsis]
MSNHMHRLQTNELELGATDAVQRHITRTVVSPKPVSQRKLDFEHSRPRWLRECMAEATGVFFYVFPGIASVAGFVLNATSPLGATAFSSIFQIGWAFALGIMFAIVTCAPTSGGHFNPAITICFAIWQGFPWKKVPYYIVSQIFGSFIAALLMAGMYWQQISAYSDKLTAAGEPLVSATGPAFIFCTFPLATQSMGYLFFIEFFVDSFIGIIIWACLDPANPFVSPASAPITIGLAYANMVWGFANISISTNLARDLGCRIVAAIFFGREAFTYMNYSWISILVNIPATIFATGYYEFLMRDSLAKIGRGHAVHAEGEEGLHRHITKTRVLEAGMTNALGKGNTGDVEYGVNGDEPVMGKNER